MADVFSSKERSRIMSRIRAKDTKPEMKIRKALHALGYRYSLHKSSLPGKPDLYLKKYNATIEINGCFWHGHDCHLFTMPKTRQDYWINKINNNRKRDDKNREAIINLGIRHLTVWECSLRGKTALEFSEMVERIEAWLQGNNPLMEITGASKAADS